MEGNFDINKAQGYISLYRSIKNSPIWFRNERRAATKFEAFIDLILSANHSNKKMSSGFKNIDLNVGDVLTSEVRLSEDWGWSRSRVRRFLESLEKVHKSVTTKRTTKYTVISIVNYGVYQNKEQVIDTANRTSSEHQVNTNNNDNNLKKETIYRLSIERKFFFSKKDRIDYNSSLHQIFNEDNILKYLAKTLNVNSVERDSTQGAFKVFAAKILRDSSEYPRLKDIIVHFARWLKTDKSFWTDSSTLAAASNFLTSNQPRVEPIQKVAPNRISSMTLIDKEIKKGLSNKLISLLNSPYDNTVGYHMDPFPSMDIQNEIAKEIICRCLSNFWIDDANNYLKAFRMKIQCKQYKTLESALNSMIRTIYVESQNRKPDY